MPGNTQVYFAFWQNKLLPISMSLSGLTFSQNRKNHFPDKTGVVLFVELNDVDTALPFQCD